MSSQLCYSVQRMPHQRLGLCAKDVLAANLTDLERADERSLGLTKVLDQHDP